MGSSWDRYRNIVVTALVGAVVIALLTIGGTGAAPSGDAAPPPAERFDHGAAGSALNGSGGEIAPSPTSNSWPGTGSGGNGGAFAFIGAQYGSRWQIPATPNNSLGVGYCVMEDVGGTGAVAPQPDPAIWEPGDMARAGALMASFGGDRVVPYGIDASGGYEVASGEWKHPLLFGGGEYTRRRQIAVNFGVKMFLEDVSPSGVAAGRTLARDTAVVRGSGGEFAALRSGYAMATRMASVADVQHALGGVRLYIEWGTADGAPPMTTGTYPVEVRATDSTGKAVGFVPIVQLSTVGIDGHRSVGALAAFDEDLGTPDDAARRHAAAATGWPTWDMAWRMADDGRFMLTADPRTASIADADGIARFDVTIDASSAWELAFHTQAPASDVTLHAGTGVQGQVTWTAAPQSASVHQTAPGPPPPPPPPPAPPTTPTTTAAPPPTTTTTTTTAPTTTSTTTSTAAATPSSTAPPSTTTTTTVPTATTATTTAAAHRPLPRTGGDHQGSKVAGAMALLLMGAGLMIVTRSRPPSTDGPDS